MNEGKDGAREAPERAEFGAEPRPGAVISRKYRLLRRLASGGMGDVYAAEHVVLKRGFALKFIRPELAGNEILERRFRKEAETAGRLVSEHIATVTDFDWAGPRRPYLVMELLDGWDLAQVLNAGPLPAGTVAEIGVQVCRGLAAAHAQGFIHRDLKPANLFLCRRASAAVLVKILDFGIAKDARAPGVEQTRPGDPVGTAHYMAPEQIQQSPDLDGRADLYALGVVLYEALSGQRPRRGDSYQSVIMHGLHEQPVALEASARQIPPGLAAVVARAMAHRPEDRFPSAEALEQALAPFTAAGAPVYWPDEAMLRPAPAAGWSGDSPPAAAVSHARPRPRRLWIFTGASAALVVGGALLFGPSGHRGAPAPAATPAAALTAPASTPVPVPPPAPAPAAAAPPPEPPPPVRRSDVPRARGPRRTVVRPAARQEAAKPPAPPPPAPGRATYDRNNPYR
jgi:serine/threonine-protein kinase